MTSCPTLPTSLHFWLLINFFTFTGEVWHIFFSPKVLINSWRRMGKTPISFSAPHQASLGIIAWESFIWLNQISHEDSNQSLTGILQWGRKKWWWQESPRTQPCSPFYRASIVYLLYIFLISATTLKHPKHNVELLEPRLQCSVHILDTSHHPHAGRWRCTLPCSPWRSSRKVPLPCFRSHEIDRRLSSHYIHKFKHIGNLESFIWLQVARIWTFTFDHCKVDWMSAKTILTPNVSPGLGEPSPWASTLRYFLRFQIGKKIQITTELFVQLYK